MPFQITVNPQKLKKLQVKLRTIAQMPADKKTAQKAGNAAIREAKRLISKGISPIRGSGSFPAYINPSKYPGKKKPHSPVNLFLTGQQLRSLIAKAVRRRKTWAFTFGYLNSPKARKKESGHKDGVNGQPSRPTIPNPPGETFHRRIVDAYIKEFRKRITRLTKL